MKKINNKGISIVEIIISISLIAIILVFLMSVLITVRNEDESARTISTLLMNQALITKEIEKDFIEYELMGVASCNDGAGSVDSVMSVLPGTSSIATDGNCLKLIFNESKTPDNIGYLLYYTYGYSATERIHAIGYRRGSKKMLRETTEKSGRFGTAKRVCRDTTCAITIDLPVINDNEDYGIHLSYVYINRSGFIFEEVTDNLYRFNLINDVPG